MLTVKTFLLLLFLGSVVIRRYLGPIQGLGLDLGSVIAEAVWSFWLHHYERVRSTEGVEDAVFHTYYGVHYYIHMS